MGVGICSPSEWIALVDRRRDRSRPRPRRGEQAPGTDSGLRVLYPGPCPRSDGAWSRPIVLVTRRPAPRKYCRGKPRSAFPDCGRFRHGDSLRPTAPPGGWQGANRPAWGRCARHRGSCSHFSYRHGRGTLRSLPRLRTPLWSLTGCRSTCPIVEIRGAFPPKDQTSPSYPASPSTARRWHRQN